MNKQNRIQSFAGLVAAALASSSALAQMEGPPMGGPMQMYSVAVDVANQSLMATPMGNFSTVQLQYHDATYMGNASVLNGMAFNAQWGWIASGFADLGSNSLWIELLSADPGLEIYRGGTMMNPGDYSAILGTNGSANRIQWSGSMLHNWYATTEAGYYEHTYRIYVGDAQGNDMGWQSAQVTWSWNLVPAPGAVAALGAFGLVGGRRRRTH
jgi:hypothetical protein